MRKRTLVAVTALALVGALAAPVAAQDPTAPAGVAILEGPGFITTTESVYSHDDPLWQACKPAVEALGVPGVPAPAVDGQTGVFLPCWGPPVDTGSTFIAEGTNVPTVTEGTPFCVSTLGVCHIDSVTHVWYREDVKAATGIQPGAYSGSSKGHGTSRFYTIPGPAGPPIEQVDYTAEFGWEQSAGTVLPITGMTSYGGNVITFVSARSSSSTGSGTGGLPSVTQTPAATKIFSVDGIVISF